MDWQTFFYFVTGIGLSSMGALLGILWTLINKRLDRFEKGLNAKMSTTTWELEKKLITNNFHNLQTLVKDSHSENVDGHSKIEATLSTMSKNQNKTNGEVKDSLHNINTCLALLSEKISCEKLNEVNK